MFLVFGIQYYKNEVTTRLNNLHNDPHTMQSDDKGHKHVARCMTVSTDSSQDENTIGKLPEDQNSG